MLFEQYDEEAQKSILSVVDELIDLLESASKLLDRNPDSERQWFSRSSSSLASTSAPERPSLAEPLSPERSSSSASLRRKLRWSFYDKKRAKDIIDRYAQRNDHLYRIVQLNSFASGIGVNLQHLENMQHNPAAKELRFDETASLQLLAKAAMTGMAANFELNGDNSFGSADTMRVEDRFVTFSENGRSYLQDTCEYKVESSDGVDHQTKSRLNGLASLLQQPKGQVFRIPKCIGWRFLPFSRDIAFIFESPGPLGSQPRSLKRLFEMPDVKPSLRDKFALSYSLAKSISQLQMVQWVHESFRSEIILFFIARDTQLDRAQSNRETLVALDQPWIFGFDFSRPESFFSYGFMDMDRDRDVYRHPSRQRQPTATFNKWHDIYSLGVVLLEIGLWEPAILQEHPRDRFRDMGDPEGIKNRLLKVAQKRLPSKMGERYRDVVVTCLTGNFAVKDDTKEDLQLQQAFRVQVVQVLAQLLQNI
ncbi:hypothetical protein BU24DRAFT_392188 [Aaosphaeria arxii CBS 175.79]|uniref:Uncharacterized protein n=1 Tax=Aaosphaeria arxii CBS 175.79 TaxID=1450172 RepID=A0A6A5XV26_9PLEO|nr:uncharacterized protein BU24DRAFT_392188 [Aaosphaeria arxii CBS 175.79]KAF2016799.1 hypothetical protein BU24DRAFT_392188 [Aaosphaeria arxii CBS 175.79]